jgi:hypothetical protein
MIVLWQQWLDLSRVVFLHYPFFVPQSALARFPRSPKTKNPFAGASYLFLVVLLLSRLA